MTSKRITSFALMLSAASAVATMIPTAAHADDTTRGAAGGTLVLAQATPGNQQRNEGVGVRGGQSGQSGQGASPQGGQGAATQTGTPPAQLKRDEEAHQRGQAGHSGASGTGAK
ncbi:hypothetical protein [Caballeronia sp. Lep1P3]|uniref:hypothetical protein n=1 Tax=Caballeronia sp. Lep1P3 TaxID=2878150 RepID=UPI001FD26406|nr:hypothetical protein [Caballeronia sp. Lep1P3]